MLFIDSGCTVICHSGAFNHKIMDGVGIGKKEKENLSCSSLTYLGDKISLIRLQRKQRPPAEGGFQEWSGGMAGCQCCQESVRETHTHSYYPLIPTFS